MLFYLLILIASYNLWAQAQVPMGVQPNPCRVEIPHESMLRLDFGQHCRFHARNAALNQATPDRVVYFGDSLTEGWGDEIVGLNQTDVINRGIGGQTTAQMLVRFKADVLKLNPKIFHLIAGTNDIGGNTGPTSVERIFENIASMAEQARAQGIRVILGSILPMKHMPWSPTVEPAPSVVAINKLLKSYAQKNSFIYADYFSVLTDGSDGLRSDYSDDGVHPNRAGYMAMRPVAVDAINRAKK